MKPNDEQKLELLERCGFTLRCPPEKDAYGRGIWNYPDGMIGDVDIDLNTLVRWAVPKAIAILIERSRDITPPLAISETTAFREFMIRWVGKNPTQFGLEDTLFWALWEVMREEMPSA